MDSSHSSAPPRYRGGVIDLRLHQARERLILVDQALQALGPDEDLLLVYHEPPTRLVRYIEDQYPGRFDLTPVIEGPAVWTLCVHPLSPSTDSGEGSSGDL